MSRAFGLAGLLVGAVLVLPSLGADDKDDKKKDDPAAKKADAPKGDKEDAPKKPGDKEKPPAAKAAKKEKFTWGMEVVGKLTMDGGSTRDFKLHVTQKTLEPDYGAQQQYAQQSMQLQQQQMRIAMARKPQDRQQAMQQYYQTLMQLSQTQARLYKAKDVNFDVELRFGENMKVRLLQPPVEYDDKGNLKKYTPKELKELQGKDDLPGYNGDMDGLRTGQIIKVYLARNQVPTKTAGMMKGGKAGQAAPKKKKADDDEEELGQARPEAVMIMVLRDPLPQ